MDNEVSHSEQPAISHASRGTSLGVGVAVGCAMEAVYAWCAVDGWFDLAFPQLDNTPH